MIDYFGAVASFSTPWLVWLLKSLVQTTKFAKGATVCHLHLSEFIQLSFDALVPGDDGI